MFRLNTFKTVFPALNKYSYVSVSKCHSVFGIKDLLHKEKTDFAILPVSCKQHEKAIDIVKRYYLSEHVLVRARNMDITNDRALDKYLDSLLKQGNSLAARAPNGVMAGICFNFATSPIDPNNLRNHAFYRQDPNIKDFLYFTAKLQETPNLWEVFKQPKIFEIKMLAVLPAFRRQGLAVMLTETSKQQARDQAFNIIRMDCINPYDYKIAERCMMQCVMKFPLYKLRGTNAPYIERTSEFNKCVRVYVDAPKLADCDRAMIKQQQTELETIIE